MGPSLTRCWSRRSRPSRRLLLHPPRRSRSRLTIVVRRQASLSMSSTRIRAVIDRIQLTIGRLRWGRDDTIRGVGGWLLFLCILLSVITPLTLLAGCGSTGTLADALAGRFPIYVRWLRICEFAELGLGFYCIYAGVKLWKVGRGAVVRTQTFLFAYLLFAELRAITPYLGELTADMQRKLLAVYGVAALKTFVFAAVWHQYLARSVRVKNTYLS